MKLEELFNLNILNGTCVIITSQDRKVFYSGNDKACRI